MSNFDLGVIVFFGDDEQVLRVIMDELQVNLRENQRLET